ncbi:FG-GAP repeat domain-containing protein [Streptomyces sp. NBC_01257]|uniref:FG-GAP repeat domain-containing protein n=1 Tax=Streptomyces sp. NBC_01257 TaxID=2903799 RepID=UPI002DD99377|nr:VCBS repeat-containing protein [Streptomyces sp. NBC_01257]WRZ65791.1 VCBS repeat-containing protein [Streptomyces sp. NBC_01257]
MAGTCFSHGAAGDGGHVHDVLRNDGQDTMARALSGRGDEKRTRAPSWGVNVAWPGFPDSELRERPGEVSFKDYVPVGDQDGNGAPELLLLTTTGTLSMVRTQPDSNVAYVGENTRVGSGWQIYNKVLSPGDLNGDARADVLARTPGGDVYFYASTGVKAAPFGPRIKIAGGWQVYDQLVGVTDNDGDGVGDVVTRTPSGQLFFHSGIAGVTPAFKAPVKLGSGWGVYNQIAGGDDMDGDGNGDLAARTVDGSLYIYKGLGQGRFAQRTQGPARSGWQRGDVIVGAGGNPAYGKSRIQALAADGKQLYTYQSLGNGLLAPRRQAPSPYKCNLTYGAGTRITTLASDTALDNRPEMLALCNSGTLTGGSEGQWSIGEGWGIYNTLVGPGDLTGDGKGDLLARDSSGCLYLYRSTSDEFLPSDPSFASRVKVGGGWGLYDRLVGAGDYTGDGRADIVARTPAGELYLYSGTGNTSAPFRARVRVGPGWQIYSKLAAIGDVDGDGRGDLLAADRSGHLYRYSSTGAAPGSGTFRARALVGGGWNTYRDLS